MPGLLQRAERELTPLQRRMEELGRVLVAVCLAIVAVIFLLQLWRGGPPLEMLLISVSLAVAAVPEGLPAVITLTLALGLQRMVKRNAVDAADRFVVGPGHGDRGCEARADAADPLGVPCH